MTNVKKLVIDNPSIIDEFEWMFLKNLIMKEPIPRLYHIDLVRELLDHLSLIPDKDNIYIKFLEELEKEHEIKDKKIIEVGGGTFPNLAKRISKKLKTGTITVYDPRLSKAEKQTEKMILKREMFTTKTPIKDTNLMIGLMPCKGIEPLINQAINNRIDFMIWLCEGGPHGDYIDYFEYEDEWLDSILSYGKRGVEKNNMGQMKVKHFPKYSEYPIIYNTKKEE